jgi:hypothetical protein
MFHLALAREQGCVEGCWLVFLGDIDRGFVLLLFCTRDATVICTQPSNRLKFKDKKEKDELHITISNCKYA